MSCVSQQEGLKAVCFHIFYLKEDTLLREIRILFQRAAQLPPKMGEFGGGGGGGYGETSRGAICVAIDCWVWFRGRFVA